MRIITAIGAPFVALAIVLALAVAAIGHTPSGGASCDGVFAQGTSYDAADTNTLTVTIDGDTETAEFDTDGYLEGAIPQDGAEHTWAWSVETTNPDPAFDAHDSGTITCGTPPPATPRASISVERYCNGVFITAIHNATATKTKVRPGVYRIVAIGRIIDGVRAEFSPSHTKRVLVKHVKRFGCGNGS